MSSLTDLYPDVSRLVVWTYLRDGNLYLSSNRAREQEEGAE